MKIRLILILVLILAVLPASSQEEKEQKVTVRLRLLPVSVFDGSDEPVKGLKAEDFELLVDGRPVSIRNVDEYDYSDLREAVRKNSRREGKGAQITASNEFDTGDLPKRRIILLFDLMSSGVSGYSDDSALQMSGLDTVFSINRARGIQMAKSTARRWIENELLPTDEVAIMTYFFAPAILQPFTTGKENILRAIDSVSVPIDMIGANLLGEDAEMGAQFASIGDEPPEDNSREQLSFFGRHYLDFYRTLGEVLSQIPGTKHMVVFSEGIIIDSESAFGINLLPELEKAVQSLSSATTRVSTIGIGDLYSSSLGSPQSSFLYSMADRTGGMFYRTRARFDSSLREAGEFTDHFYEVFFSPPENEDEGFHFIQLRVKRENVEVITPPGYLGDERYDNPEADYTVNPSEILQGLGNELNAVMAATAIPFAGGETALVLTAYVPGDMLDSDKAAELQVKFSLGVDGELYDKAEWKLVRPSENSADFRFEKVLTLPEKLCSIQLVVIDNRTGRRAYLIQGLEGKHPKGDFVTTPQFYKSADEETGIEVLEKKAADKLAGDIPQTIVDFSGYRFLQSLPSGGEINVFFVHNFLDYDEIGLYYKRDEMKAALPGEQVSEIDLGGGLKLLSYTCPVPEWQQGEVIVSPLLFKSGKSYALSNIKSFIE